MIINYKNVEAAGYKVQYVEKNIHIIENFIPAADADFLVKFGNDLSYDQWCEGYLEHIKKQCFHDFGTRDIRKLAREKKITINDYSIDKTVSLSTDDTKPSGVEESVLEYTEQITAACTKKLNSFILDKGKYELSPFFSMRRHYLDDGMPDHNDQKNSPKQRQSAVIYLNDDYNGGELYFRDQGIDLKPPAYSVAIFNNGADYVHGVRTVLEGPTRYTLASFISVK